jgi:hypothetical protein
MLILLLAAALLVVVLVALVCLMVGCICGYETGFRDAREALTGRAEE